VLQSDSDLLEAARKNEPAAWDILLKRYQLPLYTYAAEFLRDNAAALDVVQETFAAAVRYIATLRDDTRFASWLFGIAHQKCLQQLRRTKRDEVLFAPQTYNSPDDGSALEDADPRSLLLQQEQAEEFFGLVERLPDVQRATLLLHVLEDFCLEEISEIMGTPVGTVKSRLHHAKRALRALVEASR
jgi:RNA polymerase sigma-70 factor (ECF subfamily)